MLLGPSHFQAPTSRQPKCGWLVLVILAAILLVMFEAAALFALERL